MLLIFDNLVEPTKGVHGVVVTHLLAKEELRVRFSLDAFNIRVWESLATPRASGARDRRFKSDHPDCYETYSGGSCVGTGRRLLIAQTQVRFLLPELCYVEGQADWRRHSVRSGASVKALRVQLSLLPPCVR